MISAQEFINQTIGKKKDMDGAYGSQCWDYFAYFESLAGYARTNCTQTGYVADIWNYRKSNGVLKNFKEVSKSSLQKGDWIIWTKSPYGSYSHIAMFVEYAGNNKVKVISQNQSNTMEACYATLTMNGIGGCLRPNCYKEQTPNKKSVSEIAKEVINGKWGNGQDRIDRLKKAGYDANAVQAEVNKQLGASSTPKKTNEQIAKEVIQGKWGNGADRKKRLEKAGYNYNTIQALVNKML